MQKMRVLCNPLLTALAVAGSFLIWDGVLAQTDQNAVEQGREMIREARLEIVRSELNLTGDESSAFWPLYAQYRNETDAIQDRYAAMIAEYIRRYDNADLTNEYADELVDTFFAIKTELLDVQKKYLPEFRKAIPALKVARLVQLENKISAEVDAQLALVVPLVEPN